MQSIVSTLYQFAGALKKDLDELSKDYKDLSTKIFTQSPLWGTSSLVWSHSYYDTALWEQMLKDVYGDSILIKTARDPKVPKVHFLLLIYLTIVIILSLLAVRSYFCGGKSVASISFCIQELHVTLENTIRIFRK